MVPQHPWRLSPPSWDRRQRGSPPCDGWSSAAASGCCSGCPSDLVTLLAPENRAQQRHRPISLRRKGLILLNENHGGYGMLVGLLPPCSHATKATNPGRGPKSPIMNSHSCGKRSEISKHFQQNNIPRSTSVTNQYLWHVLPHLCDSQMHFEKLNN